MTRKKHYHTRREMAWLLDNDKSFPGIVEPDDVVSGLRQESLYLAT
jgi:hypothetical protein